MTTLDRRTFLRRSALAGLTGATALQTLSAGAAFAGPMKAKGGEDGVGYGRLRPRASRNTHQEILALPPGFDYWVVSSIGNTMTDGTPTPVALDGMAAFAGPQGLVRLIRNHEVRTPPGTAPGSVMGPTETKYDALGVGGTTTIDWDRRRRTKIQDFVSLNGTIVNCAGGTMLDEFGWMTCEETIAGPAQGWQEQHGYCFVTPLEGPEPGAPASSEPIPAMGRFSHEAIAVDQSTGFVYETEDLSNNPNGLYRFRPNDPQILAAGGVLEMLKVRGATNYDTREGQARGSRIAVEWVVIDDPDPDLEGGRTVHDGTRAGKRRCHIQPTRGLLVRKRQHLLHVDQRWRRQERRQSQHGRLSRGLRTGVALHAQRNGRFPRARLRIYWS